MKRLHIHMSVADIPASVKFYTALFAAEPAVIKPDYAKWMLDDPRVNFAISTHGGKIGLDHLGIQAENAGELQEVYGRLQTAGQPVLEEGETTCCYARSEKSWIADPQGISWETFLTTGTGTVYGADADLGTRSAAKGACCAPNTEALPEATCCAPKAGAHVCGAS
jgi:catechol 2,3-dioxygenase-like lactoylglutathione lyase family enzyme